MQRSAGVYVHFPYCLAKCPYCDFASYVPPGPPGTGAKGIDHAGYADAVLRELAARAPSFEGRRIESVFFGGGTPSLWEPRELGRVLAGICASLDVSPDVEVTVECNPTSLDEERARALLAAGVGRLSIGVQSLDDARLRTLGRLHDASGARRALEDARRAGVPRVSGDLIFGLPEQSPEQARDEALALVDLGLSHVSAYQLTIEPGTRFGELARRGRLPLADEGAVAESFLAIDEALGARGLAHYEISNYARPGEQARHNLGYWRGDEYLGLGTAAYGFVLEGEDDGVRYRNDPLPDRYLAGAPDTREPIDGAARARERIMLGLRMAEGVDLGRALTPERERALGWLEGRGRVVREGMRLRIPPSAWLWTDDTAARLF